MDKGGFYTIASDFDSILLDVVCEETKGVHADIVAGVDVAGLVKGYFDITGWEEGPLGEDRGSFEIVWKRIIWRRRSLFLMYVCV